MLTQEQILEKFRRGILHDQMHGQERMYFISQVVSGKPEMARGCYLWARGHNSAIGLSKLLKLYVEGSELAISEIPYTVPPEWIGILLTREECKQVQEKYDV